MTTRRIIVAVCSGLVVLVVHSALSTIWDAEEMDTTNRAAFAQASAQYEATIGVVEKLAAQASTVEQWEAVRSQAADLPDIAKKHFVRRADIGLMETLADERDRLLYNAGVLYQANEKDPGIAKNLARAKEVHERIKQLLVQIGDDPTMERQYREGYEKYRSLAFLKPDEAHAALEIIDDAMHSLKRANESAPKDNHVELAIEFLYKRAKEEEQKRGQSNVSGRPRALPGRPRRSDGGRESWVTERPHRH